MQPNNWVIYQETCDDTSWHQGREYVKQQSTKLIANQQATTNYYYSLIIQNPPTK